MTGGGCGRWRSTAGDAGQRDGSCPGGMERGCMTFHHVTQNITRFKTHDLFIYGLFHLIVLDHDWPRATNCRVKVRVRWGTTFWYHGTSKARRELGAALRGCGCRIPGLEKSRCSASPHRRWGPGHFQPTRFKDTFIRHHLARMCTS